MAEPMAKASTYEDVMNISPSKMRVGEGMLITPECAEKWGPFTFPMPVYIGFRDGCIEVWRAPYPKQAGMLELYEAEDGSKG